MPYPSLYRAKAVSIRSGSVEAFVPQVFGETTVTITDFLGVTPSAPTMGWVFFQAGNPEFPVWSSGMGGGSAGGGNGNGDTGDHSMYDEVWVGPTAPPAAQELWFDTNEPPNGAFKVLVDGNWQTVTMGGGTSTAPDEVWVGPNTPTDAATELWIDTDEPSVLTDDMRWNTAWGQVAASDIWNTSLNAANNVYTYLGTTTAVLTAGRQYTFALTQNSGYSNVAGETWGFRPELDGSALGEFFWQITDANYYINPSTSNVNFTVATTGSKTLRVGVRRVAGTGVMQCRANFVIIDRGPLSGAVPVTSPTPAWIRPTFENGWSDYGYPGWEMAAYRKIGDIVYLRGLVSRAAGDLNQQPMFTLPIGYRPPTPLIFNVNASTTSYANARLDVQNTGAVYVNDGRPGYAGFTSLSGVYFSVTPT